MKSAFIEPEVFEHVLFALTSENALVCRVCLKTGLRVGDVVSLKTETIRQGGPCDRSLKSEVPCGSCLNWR